MPSRIYNLHRLSHSLPAELIARADANWRKRGLGPVPENLTKTIHEILEKGRSK